MPAFEARIPDITIPDGTDVSNVLDAAHMYSDAVAIMLYAPASLDGGATYKIEVTEDHEAAVPVWRTLQVGDTPADVSPPASAKARAYFDLPPAIAFRVKASGNVTGDQTWKASKLVGV